MAERLATACFIVIAYLSGMRPAEVLALRRGCCVARPIDGDAVRHEITGSRFKAVLDDDGNTRPEGQERDHPWFVIQPVAEAVAVMEALSGEELLFPRQLFMEFRRVNHLAGSAAEVRRTTAAIGDFIDWVNTYAVAAGRPPRSSRPIPPAASPPPDFAAPSPGSSTAFPEAGWLSASSTATSASRPPRATEPVPPPG